MPISPTFPGVYIDELPSAVRTIIGVPTSVAAFIGTAPRGATDRPVHITGWADYEAEFGGLDKTSDMSHAVYQFYLNGGSEAEIVRIVRDHNTEDEDKQNPAPKKAVKAKVELKNKAGDAKVTLHAASEGQWAKDNLRVRVDYDTFVKPAEGGTRTTYNLTIRDKTTGITERYLNVNVDPTDPDGLVKVLASSRLVSTVEGDIAGQTVLPNEHVPEGKLDEQKKPIGPAVGADPFLDDTKGSAALEKAWYTEAVEGADGDAPGVDNYLGGKTGERDKKGLYQLLKADIVNIICLPGDLGQVGKPIGIVPEAAAYALKHRSMLLLDPPTSWGTVEQAATGARAGLPVTGDLAKNAAVYFPRVNLADPSQKNAIRDFPPCGVMAGIWARTDVQRGVWKAPAGTDASLNGVTSLAVTMTDPENGRLNPLGVNCLRQLPVFGHVAWGARTTKGADLAADQWKYLPVRRLALFLEESLYRGTQWVVFEPNDEPLWASIRLNVGAFMNNLFRQGAFQGRTPQEAYKVTCDSTNNPQNTIDQGIVNIQVGFAPLKPAEFVIIHIQQLAGQIQV
ncbi:phage tail sheath family protein [Amycolatopsis sp. NPDC059021]|uniref:phage tail sheath family protein n=1 Tax=Amycolatopsis sp. NPDC059021 TaxID=3346704 RepID=UPI00366CD43E